MKKTVNRIWRAMTRLVVILGVASPFVLWAATAVAQEGGSTGGGMSTSALFLTITYLILWGLFGGAVFFAIWRQRKLQREIDGLEKRIDDLLGTES